MTSDACTVERWTRQLAEALDVEPGDIDVPAILDLARDAAHGVERPAAPVTTFIAGYVAGLRGGGRAEIDGAVTAAVRLCLPESHAEAAR